MEPSVSLPMMLYFSVAKKLEEGDGPVEIWLLEFPLLRLVAVEAVE